MSSTIPSTKRIPCKYAAQGVCRFGNSCNFIHFARASPQTDLELTRPILSNHERRGIGHAVETRSSGEAKSSPICKFFLQGSCNRGGSCLYLHPSPPAQSQHVSPDTVSPDSFLHQQGEKSPRSRSDSRSTVPCKFVSRSGGCQNASCPYLHPSSSQEAENVGHQDFDGGEDEVTAALISMR